MNKTYKKILDEQRNYFEYIDDLFEIVEETIKETQPDDDMVLSILAIRCFNYGVMVGKRQERKKDKNDDNI